MNKRPLTQTATALLIAITALIGCKKDPVNVSGVSLNKTILTIAVGGNETLEATIMPANTENKAVTWAVTGDAATVDANGKVTAVKAGTAIVTVTTADGGLKAECTVTVTAIMTMTTAITGEVAIYLAGTREAVIDWGDGSAPETVTLSTFGGFNNSHKYTHTFSDANSRTIVVEGYNITHLACTDLQLTALDVTKNTAMRVLACSDNPLKSLDVTKNTALRQLSCWDNQLTSLDITKNTTMELLYCSDNQLTSLDVTRNTAMIHIDCAMNQIVSLDMTKNTALTGLDCHGNQLTSLDVTNNTALTYLSCHSNQFTAEGLNTMFGTLHSNAGTKDIYIINTPGTDGCDRSIATAKGWKVH